MRREQALKVVLLVVGLLFTAGVYPLIGSLLHPADSDSGDTMMLSLYVALGIFLLIAVRNPFAHRSLIAFAAWSSFAHAVAMCILGLEIPNQRVGFLVGFGCARCDRHSANCAGSGKADSRASIGSHNIALPQTT
jgi:Family of unknown function (DUF6632)